MSNRVESPKKEVQAGQFTREGIRSFTELQSQLRSPADPTISTVIIRTHHSNSGWRNSTTKNESANPYNSGLHLVYVWSTELSLRANWNLKVFSWGETGQQSSNISRLQQRFFWKWTKEFPWNSTIIWMGLRYYAMHGISITWSPKQKGKQTPMVLGYTSHYIPWLILVNTSLA